MKLKDGKITLLFSHDGCEIELTDWSSTITFAKVKLNQKQTCQALSRLCDTSCVIEVNNLDKVGKKRIQEELIIELPKETRWDEEVKTAKKLAIKATENTEWKPSLSFDSQDSFFTKDGKKYARTRKLKWIDFEEEK